MLDLAFLILEMPAFSKCPTMRPVGKKSRLWRKEARNHVGSRTQLR